MFKAKLVSYLTGYKKMTLFVLFLWTYVHVRPITKLSYISLSRKLMLLTNEEFTGEFNKLLLNFHFQLPKRFALFKDKSPKRM